MVTEQQIGVYRVIRSLGGGNMGVVYLVEDMEGGGRYALKRLSPSLSPSEKEVRRFRREFMTLSRLKHPHIVEVYESGIYQDSLYFVMEYVQGPTLRQRFLPENPPSDENLHQAWINSFECRERVIELLLVMRQICDALAWIHNYNIIHRDLKPENILLHSENQAKLLDFGIAQRRENPDVSQSRSIMGTLTYISPEQAQCEDVDGRSDLYSLGVVLYEMLAGRPPFVSPEPIGRIYMHLNNTPPPLYKWNPQIDPQLENIVIKLLAKKPLDRYQRAEDLSEALGHVLASYGIYADTQTSLLDVSETIRAKSANFVGRNEEISALLAHIDTLIRDRLGDIVIITGNSGIGKTRLARELLNAARIQQIECCTARCLPESPPYTAYQELIEQLRTALTLRSEIMPEQLWGSLADTWFSMMQSHVAHSADPDTMTPSLQDAENEKFLLFMTLKQMLECFLEREPLILMIDDLMYADETSLALTEYLAQQLLHGQTTYPLLILGLFRNEDVHTEHQLNQFLLRLSSPHCLYHIYDLKPLTREDVIDIATAMLGLPPAEEALEQLMIQSQGIPFFVEELLKAWSEDKQIAEAEDRWYLLNHAFAPEGSSPKLNDLPLALQKRLEYRIQRLTPEAFELATHIAICGQEVSFDLLIAVIQWSEGELLSGLEQLLQHKILLEDWTVGIERYRFAHPEIQKTLSKKLEASQRRKLHLVVAQALKQTGQAESSFELLAHHFLAAEDIGQGSWYLLLAAEQQLYAFAHRSCGELLNRCQTLLQTHVEDPLLQPHSTLWLRYHLARCEWYEQMGNYRTGIQCVEQALSDYPPHLDRAALWRWQAAFYRRTGNYAESLKVIQKALTDTPSESEWRALILQEAGRIYRTQGKQSAALETLREALAWAIAKQLHSQQGRLYGLIGEVLHQRGEYIEAFAYYQLSLDTARQHHDLYGEIEALCRLSALSLDRAETSDALEHTEQAIDLARKISARYAECLSLSLLGRLQFARRLYEEAQATFREALSIAIELGTMRMESQLLGYIGMIFFAEQRWPSARIYLEEGLQKAVRIGDPTIELRLRAYLCALDVVQQHRHTDDVASDFQRILKQSEQMELLENTLLCRILMAYIWRHLHQLQRSREQLVSARYLAHLIGHKRFLALIEIEFYQLQCIVNAHNYSAPPA